MSWGLLPTPVVSTLSDPSENHALIPSTGLYCSEVFHLSPFFIHTIFLPNLTVKVILQRLFHLYFVSFWAFIFIPLVCLKARNLPNQNCNGIRNKSSSISNIQSYLSSDPTPVSPRQHHWCSCLAQQASGVLAVLNEPWSLRTSL
jgi:hypothetical protein